MKSQGGALMIEVMVTIVIVIIGMWGLISVQAQLQKSELESYQRSQAIMLLNDISDRLLANRANALSYTIADPTADFLGFGMTCPAATVGNLAEEDVREWCQSLQGNTETIGGNEVGSMINGRGCVEDLGSGQYLVTIVWQGLTPIFTPLPRIKATCGKESTNVYDGAAGSDCQDDLCRRYIATTLNISNLAL
ncbi:MAG: hypothetical protein V7696_15685 [Halioglobus sp.]